MSETKQEWGDDILQVDSLKPEAAPDEERLEAERGLKRTTAGQEDRQSPPPEPEDGSPEGPSRPRREGQQSEELYEAQE